MGIISTGAKIIGGGIIGGMLASSCSGDNVTQYVQGMQLRQENEKIQLYSAPLDKMYNINIVNEDIFLGDAAHNAIGFQKLTEQKYKGD